MERRKLLSILGTGAVGAGGLGLVVALDRGYVELPGDGDRVNETLSAEQATFEYDAEPGEYITVKLSISRTGSDNGHVRVTDPAGTDLADREFRTGLIADRYVYVDPEVEGTHELFVDVADAGRVDVRVFYDWDRERGEIDDRPGDDRPLS